MNISFYNKSYFENLTITEDIKDRIEYDYRGAISYWKNLSMRRMVRQDYVDMLNLYELLKNKNYEEAISYYERLDTAVREKFIYLLKGEPEKKL